MKTVLLSLVTASLVAIALQPGAVRASDWANAVDSCQGSLPSFEGALRKRPLGINNEGNATSFVSCSLRVPLDGVRVDKIYVLLHNRGNGSASVSCTLVDGLAQPSPIFTPVYQPKTVTIDTGALQVLTWEASSDNAGAPYNLPNLNCALPPGTEINTLQIDTSAPAT